MAYEQRIISTILNRLGKVKQKLGMDYSRKLDQEVEGALLTVMSRFETIEKKVDTPKP